MQSTMRFADPQLLNLGRPPALAAQSFSVIYEASKVRLAAEVATVKFGYTVAMLETDPGMVLQRPAGYRDLARRQAIDDAVAQTYLGSSTGGHLDHRASDYGVLRRSLPHTLDGPAPANRPPAVPVDWEWDASAQLWLESDDSVRLRGRLAWEALSVAGPAGAYVYHAIDAHPDAFDAIAYGPESGYVQPGEGLIVVQSRSNGGVPTNAMMDVIAARLDAFEIRYGDGTNRIVTVRNDQSVRPLGDRVTIVACQPINYTTTATLYVRADGDRDALVAEATKRLNAYQDRRRRIGMEVPISGRIAALHVADANGLPIVDEVEISGVDITPNHLQLPVPNEPVITVTVR